MEARFSRSASLAGVFFLVCLLGCPWAGAAGFRSKNFTVLAPTPELAREIGLSAERLRKELAIEWLGKEMPAWSKPCPISAQVSPNLGAGGATSFLFQNGEVFKWRMSIQGSRVRILDSVLPHEITHTIFASHFRQPLPRWADEGACTTVEHESEKAKQKRMLIRFLQTGHGIAFSDLFAMKEYPQDVMPLYSQGYSLARFLIAQGGKKRFLDFVGDGLRDENWPRAVRKYYGAESLWALQETWLDWVRDGSPSLQTAPRNRSYTQMALATAQRDNGPSKSGLLYRAQSEDSSSRSTPASSATLASGSTQNGDSLRAPSNRPSGQPRSPSRLASPLREELASPAQSVYRCPRGNHDLARDGDRLVPEKMAKGELRDITPLGVGSSERVPTVLGAIGATFPEVRSETPRDRVLLEWQRRSGGDLGGSSQPSAISSSRSGTGHRGILR